MILALGKGLLNIYNRLKNPGPVDGTLNTTNQPTNQPYWPSDSIYRYGHTRE